MQLKSGASGYLLKCVAVEYICQNIKLVLETQSPISRAGARHILNLTRRDAGKLESGKSQRSDVIRARVFDRDNIAFLEMADNGRFENLVRDRGNGLCNIEKRSQELGASVRFVQMSELGGLSICSEVSSVAN